MMRLFEISVITTFTASAESPAHICSLHQLCPTPTPCDADQARRLQLMCPHEPTSAMHFAGRQQRRTLTRVADATMAWTSAIVCAARASERASVFSGCKSMDSQMHKAYARTFGRPMRTEVEQGHLPWKLDRSRGSVAMTDVHAEATSSSAARHRACCMLANCRRRRRAAGPAPQRAGSPRWMRRASVGRAQNRLAALGQSRLMSTRHDPARRLRKSDVQTRQHVTAATYHVLSGRQAVCSR
jgi:hypothetical protein